MATAEVGRQSEDLGRIVEFYESLQVVTEANKHSIGVKEAEDIQRTYEALTKHQRSQLDGNIDLLARSLIDHDMETGMPTYYFCMLLISYNKQVFPC